MFGSCVGYPYTSVWINTTSKCNHIKRPADLLPEPCFLNILLGFNYQKMGDARTEPSCSWSVPQANWELINLNLFSSCGTVQNKILKISLEEQTIPLATYFLDRCYMVLGDKSSLTATTNLVPPSLSLHPHFVWKLRLRRCLSPETHGW